MYLQRGRQALIAIADWSPDLSNYTSPLSLKVRKTPCRPRSWANFNLL